MRMIMFIVAGAMILTGCESTNQGSVVKQSDLVNAVDVGITPTDQQTKPIWITSLGSFKRSNPEMAKKYIIVVGTSQPVESQQFEQNAEKSAYANAIDNLVYAIGIDVEKFNTGSEVWSNETRDLVIGTFKKAMTYEMGKHKINVENDSWYGYYVKENAMSARGSQKMQSYMKKGLFILDKSRLDANLAKNVAQTFEKKLAERVTLNKATQKRLANQAAQMTANAFGAK